MAVNAQTPDPDVPKLIILSEGVFLRQEIDNIAWADMGEYVLVVDALERPELEQEVFELLRDTVGGKPVRYLLNTHTHYDHVALNSAFEKRYGTEIVNARTPSLPADGRWFEGAGRRALMLPLPNCHTRDDCVVWMPDDRALFTGDIFGWGLIPWDGSITEEKRDELLAAYRQLISLDAVNVVPGHGPVCSTDELRRWIEYFEWLMAAVKDAYARGLADTQALGQAVPPPQDMAGWWRFCQWKHDDCLKKILRAVRLGRI